MPVLRSIRERFAAERPLDGVCGRAPACTSRRRPRTSCARCVAGGAEVALCAANPLSTQDDVAAALAADGVDGARPSAARTPTPTRARRRAASPARRRSRSTTAPTWSASARRRPDAAPGCSAAPRRRRPGCVRLRALEAEGRLACPVLAVNEARDRARVQRPLRHRPVDARRHPARDEPAARRPHRRRARLRLDRPRRRAARPRAPARQVIVCEVDPMRALEARMEGFEVMPALEAAERGRRLHHRHRHPRRAPPRALRADEGRRGAGQRRPLRRRDRPRRPAGDARPAASREVRPLVEQYELDGAAPEPARQRPRREPRRGEGHPAAVMDVSFAVQALVRRAPRRAAASRSARACTPVPAEIDREVARLKLESLGVGIDALRPTQQEYLRSWAPGSRVASPRMSDGLQASVEKMRARRGVRRGDRDVPRTTTSGCAAGETGHAAGVRDRAGRRPADARRRCPSPATRARGARRGRRPQAQRRARHEHGHDEGQVAAARSRTG